MKGFRQLILPITFLFASMAGSLSQPFMKVEENHLPGSPVTARDYYLEALLGRVYENASGGGPLAGTNIWAWGGFGKPHPIEKVLDHPGAFVGDPLGEMQGLNSVYAGDITTLRIVQVHALEMQGLIDE